MVFDPGYRAVGKSNSQWASRSMDAWERMRADQTSVSDSEVASIVFDCIAACYRITHELLTDLGILTESDVFPVMLAVWGYDPKALPAAGGG